MRLASERVGVSRAVGAAIVSLVVVVGAVSLALASGVLPGPPAPNSASAQVVARAIAPDGAPVTNATYALGQPLLLAVSVPNSTSPVAVHQVFSGRVYGDLAWNVNATHYTYVINSGPADPADIGVNHVYAIVTFANGSTARSNNVTMTVLG